MKAMHIVRLGLVALALAGASCTASEREGTGTTFLIIDSLTAASGAEPGTFGTTLRSDVVTVVNNVSSTFNDVGQASFRLALKDPLAGAPTQNQAITINRYRVRYIRADGRNTQGVDVPYGFDGAVTATIGGSSQVGFEIVRHTAKGHDQTGHEVSVAGQISIAFGNFGDPAASGG
jgi:hypothetical protein